MKFFYSLLCGLLLMLGDAMAQSLPGVQMADLAQIRQGVRSRRISSADPTGGNGDNIYQIPAGAKRTFAEIKGSGIINHIWITLAPTPDKLCRNDIILRMYWDGQEYPSVESPIGPFFGQGWDEQYDYAALPLAAGPRDGTGLTCYFAMPFANGARLEIENQNDIPIECLYFYVDYVEMESLPESMGRFHAWYNHTLTDASPEGETEWGVVGKPGYNKDGKRNYIFADIKGKGHFVGINYYIHNPSPMWYGEGDDMWFIDGESKPSLAGTGTEDFFNTSWCPSTPFMHPYYGYPRVNGDIGWLGRTHVYRFFIADPVFFDRSLKVSIEHGHANNLTLDLASVAYWYQDKAMPLPKAPTKEQRALKPMIGVREIHTWRHEWRKNHGATPYLWGDEK